MSHSPESDLRILEPDRQVVCVACCDTDEPADWNGNLPGITKRGQSQAAQRGRLTQDRVFDLVFVDHRPAATSTAQAITKPMAPANSFLVTPSLYPTWPDEKNDRARTADLAWMYILPIITQRDAKRVLIVGDGDALSAIVTSAWKGTPWGDPRLRQLTSGEGITFGIKGTSVFSPQRLVQLPQPAT